MQLQLFLASKSKQIIKSRKKSKWRVPIIYAVLGILLAITSDIVFGIVFLTVGILWYFVYPGYLAKRYVKIYAKSIEENYSNRFGKPTALTFNDEFIEEIDYLGEWKLRIKEIEHIYETNDYCFLKFSSGVGMILPLARLAEKVSIIEYLKKMAETHGIPYETNSDWKSK